MDIPARVTDKSTLHAYRIELPILIDDCDLSVHAFRLYVHLKRRAGDSGSCWEGARALAKACNMSLGKTSEAKQELTKKGLITIRKRKTPSGDGDDITIVDIWPKNFETYNKKDDSVQNMNASETEHTEGANNTSVHNMNAKRSQYELMRSPGELMRSQYEREEDPRKKIHKESGAPTHSAIELYTSLTGLKPIKFAADRIANEVSDLSRWRDTVQEWLSSGYKPNNVVGMLDWYNGTGRNRKPQTNSQAERRPADLPLIKASTVQTPEERRAAAERRRAILQESKAAGK